MKPFDINLKCPTAVGGLAAITRTYQAKVARSVGRRVRRMAGVAACTFCAFVGSAFADGIYMTNMTVKVTPATVAVLTSATRAPGAHANDIVEFVLSAQVANAAGGPGVYFTTYLAPGVEVMGAWFVTDATGTTTRPPGSGGHANNGWGARGSKTPFGPPFASVLNGRQNAVYGDTGIFYSTDARTVLFTADSSNIAKGPLGNPAGTATASVGYNATNTFNLKVDAFNRWDADQVNAFGVGGALNSVPVNPAPASSASVINSVGQGAAPFGAGSAVAGPDTGYTLDNTGSVGPWRRVQYAGSQKANIASGPATAVGTTDSPDVLDASALGVSLSDSSPLPSTTNALRWSDGLRLLNEATFVKIRVRINAAALTASDGVVLNFEASGSDNWGSGSKDNPWRYFGPTAVRTASLHVSKTLASVNGAPHSGGVIPAGATLSYKVRYANLGTLPVSLVTMADTIPAGVATVGCSATTPSLLDATSGVTFATVSSGTTTCPAGGATLQFGNLPNVVGGRLGALRGGEFTYNVKLSPTLANGAVVASNSTFTATDVIAGTPVNEVSTASATVGVPPVVPKIDVIHALNTAVLPVNATTFDIPYSVEVKNTGTVNATNVQANHHLPSTFTTGSPVIVIQVAPSIASGSCAANASFNGNANTALLSGTNTLTPGQSCKIHYTVRTTYGSTGVIPAAAQNSSVYASSASATNAGHTFPSGVATPPTDVLATDQSTDGNTFPTTANGDTPSPTPALLATIALSGKVFNDVNGSKLNDAGDAATSTLPAGLNAVLVNTTSGNVVAIAAVPNSGAPAGDFVFSNFANGSYSVLLTTSNPTIGGVAPSAGVLPAGWANTGENNSGVVDTSVDGRSASVNVAGTSVSGVHFGIQQRPIGQNNSNATQANPGGATQAPVAATSFSSGASDLDGGSVVSYQVAFPTNADNATLNGVSYTPASFASAFPIGHVVVPVANIGSITVDPVGTDTAAVTSVFPFRTVDNAGATSANLYTATVPFGGVVIPVAVNVSGNVYNDINGGSVDGAGSNVGGLTAYVVGTAGTTVGKAPVAIGGGYSVSGIAAGSYIVRISTNGTGAIGSVPPAVALPTNFVHTGEGVGAIPTSADGSIDGITAITVVTTDVTNVNFGLQQRPSGQSNVNATQANPGGNVQMPVAATTFTAGSSDPDGGAVVSYQVGFPTNADNATVNSVSYTPASFASAFPIGHTVVAVANIGNITVDPAGAGTGVVTSVFPFRTVDNAGATSVNTYNATVPFSGTSDMSVALGVNTPTVLRPGQGFSALTIACTNAVNSAVTPICVPSASAGTVSNIACNPVAPANLAAGASISCTYDYLAPGTQGGADEPVTAVVFTGTTGATNDSNAANNVATINAVMLDAVDDSTGAPGGSIGQTNNLATNDQLPLNSIFTIETGSTCTNASVSSVGIATFDVQSNAGCVVNYRLCAPAPNSSVCDPATLSVAATASDMIPVLSGLPVSSSPGSTIGGTVTCTNAGPASASRATCTVKVVSSTATPLSVNVTGCSVSTGTASALPVGATLVCPFTYTSPGQPGGTDTIPNAVTITGITGAANDSNGGTSTAGNNSTAAVIVDIVDAIDDSVDVPFGVTGTLDLMRNDTRGAAPANPRAGGNVTLLVTSPMPPDVTVDAATGVVVVASRALPGTYVFTYQICAQPAATPVACDTALVTINILAKIDIVKAVGVPKQTGTKTFDIPYVVVVGMVSGAGGKIFNVQANDNLRATFGTATSVAVKAGTYSVKAVNGSCNANNAFDGGRDTKLLAGIDALAAGQHCVISFTASVDFGANPIPLSAQLNRAYASAVSRPEIANPGYSFSGESAFPPSVASTTDESTTGTPPPANSAPGIPPVTPALPSTSSADTPAPTPVTFARQQLGVAKRVVGVNQLMLRSYLVTFEVVVANVGSINATNVQVKDNFATALLPPVVLNAATALVNSGQAGGASPAQCAANTNFGLANANLMSGQTSLDAGHTCTYRFTLSFTTNSATGPFNVGAIATSYDAPAVSAGSTPSGAVFASDVSDSGGSPIGTNPGAPGDTGVDSDPTPVILPSAISGAVWNDSIVSGPGNRVRDAHEPGLPGFTVEVIYPPNTSVGGVNVGGQIAATTAGTPATAVTDSNGDFALLGVPTGSYQMRFRAPTTGSGPGPVAGVPVSGDPNSIVNRANGTLDITVQSGVNISQQGMPIDPSGFVYHSVSREPIGAVRLEMFSPNGVKLPASCMLPDQQSQVTASSGASLGFYRFDLIPGADPLCPTSVTAYTIRVTPPPGYVAPSTVIPPAPALASQSATYPVSPFPTAPQVGQPTVYHLTFNLGATSADVIHNHIPMDSTIGAQLFIQKLADKREAELGDSVLYQIKVKNPNAFALPAVKVIDKLPLGFKLIAGTSSVQIAMGTPTLINDAAVLGSPGPLLTYTLGTVGANTEVTIAYRVRLGIGADRGDATNVAYAQSGAIRSLNAQAKVHITAGVFTTDACIVGKVFVDCNNNQLQDKGEIGIPGVRLYLENGTNFITDENGQYSVCGLRPITHTLRLDETTAPTGARFGVTSNRNVGHAASLFVDLKHGELHRADFREDSCTPQVMAQVQARLRAQPATQTQGALALSGVPTLPTAPSANAVAATGVARTNSAVAEANASDTHVRRLDGVALPSINGGVPVVADAAMWLRASLLPKGSKITLAVSNANVPADGRTVSQIHVQLIGVDGEPLKASHAAPFKVQLETTRGQLLVPTMVNAAEGSASYSPQGGIELLMTHSVFNIGLQAPANPDTALLRASSGLIAAERELNFIPNLRPLMVVGLAEGGINFKKLGKVRSDAADVINTSFEDSLRNWTKTTDERTLAGRVALFAKGVVGNDYLLTAAVDSDKISRERLFRDIDPNAFYPIYGDASAKQFDAQSTSRAYLRVDKDKNHFLYGDYSTGSEGNKLSRYHRSLTGIKLHIDEPSLKLNTFAARSTNRSYVDEQPGRGISGPYSIGRPNAIANSEQVELIVRDRNSPAIVLTRRTLTRFVDYDFEPFSGRLLFRQPIPSIDEYSNPVSIRVAYEVDEDGDKHWIAGFDAKLAVSSVVAIGANFAKDSNPSAPYSVGGVSAEIKLRDRTTLVAEAAQSHGNQYVNRSLLPVAGMLPLAAIDQSGNAARIEIRHDGSDLRASGYVAKADATFQNPSAGLSPGRQEAGARIDYKVSDTVTLNGEWRDTQDNSGTTTDGAKRAAATIGIGFIFAERFTLDATVNSVKEQKVGGVGGYLSAIDAQQASLRGLGWNSTTSFGFNGTGLLSSASTYAGLLPNVGATALVANDYTSAKLRLTNKATDDLTLYGEYEHAADARQRAALGGEYRISATSRVFARHEFTDSLSGAHGLTSSGSKSSNTAIGMDAEYMKDGQVFSEYRLAGGQAGQDVAAAIGVRNLWRVGEGVRVSTALEQQTVDPSATASQHATAMSVGVEYTGSALYKMGGKLEYRTSNVQDFWLSTLAYDRKLNANWTTLIRNLYLRQRATGTAFENGVQTQERLQAGLAYRDTVENLWHALGRIEHRVDESTAARNPTDSTTTLASLHGNYHPSRPWTFAGELAHKSVNERFAIAPANSTSVVSLGNVDKWAGHLIGGRVIWDFAERLDVSIYGSTQAAKAAKLSGVGAELGYRLMDNAWLSGGFTRGKFSDIEAFGSNQNWSGWHLRLRFKFDEKSISRATANAVSDSR